MKAWVLDRYGKGQALRLTDLPDPAIGDRDVLVAIQATGLNPLDNKIRDGAFKPFLRYKPPFVLGHDFAGKVVAVGTGVRGFKVGDAVHGRPRDGRIGTFATRIAVDAVDVAKVPANLSMAQAAALPLVALTAWQALVEIANVRAGQKVLIHAGSGGVGTIAIQLAKHLGATVATTTSAANADLVRGLGADIVIDYRTQDFSEQLSGYDVVLASLDAKTLEKSLKVLKPGGRLISLAGPPDAAFARQQGLNPVMGLVMRLLSAGIRRKAKRVGATYSFLFMRADGDQLTKFDALVEQGAIRPVIDRTFPFTQLNAALDHVDSGRAKGKVVVDVA
ncbi:MULTISPECIES: NADP-dependent oxidoreductase [unclassified Sphingomonas]|uniref:NADP-dependent oxidoreductase n=1 Tax=unclassified Sphingomonas TaxID=196159 RepID=UPI0007006710|nr:MULTISPECIES: NADP-dependent oxidoreductase [unclassified Sphingomonas]KQM23900.1 NADPH:quinone oxidoreductase [Sphingomonas sp. Leaf9]KQM42028.1 NADPH:quinone oxidoreductase [Sphingomonas sp. Leaf11]